MKQKLKLLTIDPGDVTAWAYWTNSMYPVTGDYRLNRILHSTLEAQLGSMWDKFDALIDEIHPTLCIIEGVEVWEGSLKSHTASIKRKGQDVPSLFKLAKLVGGYCNICYRQDIKFEIITFRKWGGQLSPEAVRAQVQHINKRKYRSQHIYDAVAMGFNHLGKL